MKKITFLFSFIALTIVGLGIYSCQKGEESSNNLQSIDAELNLFLSSKEFYELKKNFNIQSNYLNFERTKKDTYSEQKVNVFYIPVQKNGNLLGKLAVFSKNNGEKYKTLYEDFSKFTEIGGTTTIYTSKKQFVADFNIDKIDNKFQASINRVNNSSTFLKMSAMYANSEFPTSDDGWWNCTTRCYKIVKDACDEDPECKFECDLLGLGSYCTLSIASACAIHCM